MTDRELTWISLSIPEYRELCEQVIRGKRSLTMHKNKIQKLQDEIEELEIEQSRLQMALALAKSEILRMEEVA